MKKMKLKLSAISVILIFAMIFGSLVSCGEPSEPEVTTEPLETVAKEYGDYSIDMKFDDNKVVAITQPYMYDYEYTAEDFAHIGCIDIDYVRKYPKSKKQYIGLILDKHSKQNVLDAIRILGLRPDIVRAEIYVYGGPLAIPNDTYYTPSTRWPITKIELPDAWDIEKGSSDVLVGVIDSGIDGSHPDLCDNINVSLSKCFTPDYTDPLEDATGHGTHVAGIIGAVGNNATGIAGTCWDVQLVSLRIGLSDGSFTCNGLAEAINYAEEKGIKILNFSGYCDSYNSEVDEAIENYSGIIICGAGNSGENNDATPIYPASYNYNNIISVGSSTSTDAKCSHSCYGQNSVDLFAPGDYILSCFPMDACSADGSCETSVDEHYSLGYHKLSGTSMAAPYVTGVAALLLSHQSNLSAVAIKRIILNNVDEVSGLSTYCATGGRLNANAAIRDPAIHRTHTMELDTNYRNIEKHRKVCNSCGHMDYDAHTWTMVQVGVNSADASINYLPTYECTVCGFTSPLLPPGASAY